MICTSVLDSTLMTSMTLLTVTSSYSARWHSCLRKGADVSALFMSVIETAKRNGLNVFGYLSYLMLVLPSWGKTPSEEQLDSIMPWSAALPETCHRTYHQIVENMAEVK